MQQRYHLQRISNDQPLNPNGKLRLYGIDFDTRPFLALATLRFVRNDKSIYLAPGVVKPINLEMRTADDILVQHRLQPGKDFHVSFHQSGVVNVTIGRQQVRLQHACKVDETRPILSYGVSNIYNFKPVLKAPKKADCAFPVGLFGGNQAVFVSVFRLEPDKPLSDEAFIVTHGNPIEFVFSLRGRPEQYLFSIWPHARPAQSEFMVYAGAPPGGIPDLRAGRNA